MSSAETVLVAYRQNVLLSGLKLLLETKFDISVVGEVTDGRSAMELAERLHPDCALIDLGLQNVTGADAARHILSHNKDVKVIVWSDSRRHEHQMIELVRAGVHGLLFRDCSVEDFGDAVRRVLSGGKYFNQDAVQIVVSSCVNDRSAKTLPRGGRATPRERQVLELLAGGKSTKEIAAALGVSVKTVETHRKNLMDKLDLHSVAELTKFAIREGLTSVND